MKCRSAALPSGGAAYDGELPYPRSQQAAEIGTDNLRAAVELGGAGRTLSDLLTGEETMSFYERSDVAVVPAGGVIGEAMVCIVLAGAVLEKFGGDHVDELRRNFAAFQATVGPREPSE